MSQLDVSRVTYVMSEKKSATNNVVTIGFADMESAGNFHQWIAERSKRDAAEIPISEATARNDAKDFVDRLCRIQHVTPELRHAIESRVVQLIGERAEQIRTVNELTRHIRRIKGEISRLNRTPA